MAGKGEHVDILLLHVNGHVAHSLHRVGVEQHPVLLADGADLRDGLKGADLIVGVHNGHQAGLLRDGGLQLLGPDNAVFVDRQVGDSEALLFQCLAGVQHRVVLESGSDDMGLALFLHGVGRALNGPVVAFGAAAGEVDFPGLGAQAAGHGLAGLFQGLFGLLAQGVQAGGVAIHFLIKGQHGLQHLGSDSGGGGVVRVNLSAHVCSSFLSVTGKRTFP